MAVADEDRCKRCRSFLPGNSVSLRHGARRAEAMVDPEGSDLFQEWAADLGGVDQLTTGQRAVLRRVAEADRICQTALTYLVTTQESLAAGRVQKALAVLATHAGNVYRGASILGLDRKAREVSAAEYVEQRAREASSK